MSRSLYADTLPPFGLPEKQVRYFRSTESFLHLLQKLLAACPNVHTSLPTLFAGVQRRTSNEFNTMVTLLSAIAAPAITGFK